MAAVATYEKPVPPFWVARASSSRRRSRAISRMSDADGTSQVLTMSQPGGARRRLREGTQAAAHGGNRGDVNAQANAPPSNAHAGSDARACGTRRARHGYRQARAHHLRDAMFRAPVCLRMRHGVHESDHRCAAYPATRNARWLDNLRVRRRILCKTVPHG